MEHYYGEKEYRYKRPAESAERSGRERPYITVVNSREYRGRRIAEKRRRLNKPALPTESRLLEAMRAGLPASSGCALGMERAAIRGASKVIELGRACLTKFWNVQAAASPTKSAA